MRTNGWSLLQVGIDHLSGFTDAYGFVAGDEVLRFTAILLNEVDDLYGTLDDFIGHASSDSFILITMSKDVATLSNELRRRFEEAIKSHYNFMDRERGSIQHEDGSTTPMMRLSIGIVSDKTQRFSDIREITETAAELRRLDQQRQSKTV